MSEKTLVAELPLMKRSDLLRFEKEGGIWGQQRAVRKKQVYFSGGTSVACCMLGGAWLKSRKNTSMVLFGTLPVFAIFGAISGHGIALSLFPSLACNKETTMMKRVWWAKECSKEWDMNQVDKGVWKANAPNTVFWRN